MRNRIKDCILPQVYTGGIKNDKPWFVYFSKLNPYTGKLKRFRIYEGFRECISIEDKKLNAKKLIYRYNKKLQNGWDPFESDKKIVYADSLSYEKQSRNIDKEFKLDDRSVRVIFDNYLKKIKLNVSNSTYQKYQSELRLFIRFLRDKNIGYDVFSVTEKNALAFFNYLKTEKKLSNKTMNHYKVILKCVWDLLRNKAPGFKNPFDEIKKFSDDSIPQKPIKKGMLVLIKSKCEKTDPQLWLAAQFLYYCFIRPKELRFLKIADIDFFEGKITINSEFSKNRKTRIVDINKLFLEDLINKYKLHDCNPNNYIFTINGTPGLKQIGKNYFWEHFNKIRQELNIPNDYIFYAFKHTGNVAALKAGANIHDLKNQNGHSSIAITETYLRSMVGYESDFFKNNMPEI